ncbi:HMA2 domain-containing protein [Piscinibacter sp.]|uniref:HMA2 domain-containing protein n=1 Tax=Piscinibacter sp. TaxID=1903157 RepID=UPI0039E34105
MSRIVSSLPGRIRVRDKTLRDAASLAQIHAQVERIAGVSAVESNAVTGSVLLRFDAARLDVAALEARIDRLVDALAARAKSQGDRRMRVNKAAKLGMLGSLATSMALVAAGSKKGHAAAGCVFLACLGVHLTTHRRRLLR